MASENPPAPPAPKVPYHPHLAKFLRRFAGLIGRGVYRINVTNPDHLPATGGVLLLPNHLTWIDAMVLQLACPRPIRFLVYDSFYRHPVLGPLLKLFNAIPISAARAKEALRAAVEHLQAGDVVCLFPEGALTRTGTLLRLQKGFELIARKAGTPVVPVWMDQLWGSIFSFEGGKYFSKLPRRWPYPVTVAFGEPLAAAAADVATVREKLLELGEDCYGRRPALGRHLAEMCLRGLKKSQFETAVIDGTDHSILSRGMLLAAAIALSKRVKESTPGKRVAIVLPPGKGGVLANLAVLLAGKVPVNMNFTAGRDALQAAMRRGEVGAAITAKIVERKLEHFPWPETILRLDEEMPKLKQKIVFWRGLVAGLPWRALARLLKIPKKGGKEEAVLLFTSGSSGEPKGVVLSHRNILANVSQFRVMVNLKPNDAVLASLPFFHSFGCTVTLWFPMLEGLRAVTYPNPLEVTKNAELIHKYKCSLFLATPTFLRSYLRKAEKEQLESLRLVVTGAEKLPRELAKSFQEKFGKQVMEGYGLTETSPVLSVNLPDVVSGEHGEDTQPAYRLGSVGKLAPGIAAHIRHPDTGEHLSLHDTGMLWVRGPNIFEGYLGEPEKTAGVIEDGWFKTGDLGRFDEDGFLFIEGRLSRFSKIAGEMVPHETVESKINEALASKEGERTFVIVGVPDEAKGEALVLLSTIDVNLADLRGKLQGMGVANLWAPRTVRRVDALPTLGSGKLDLKGCKDLAMQPQPPAGA